MERTKIAMKLTMMTVGSAVFGFGMGIFMGSFEYNMTMGIDTNRGGWSQVRQHYFGYWRFLKKQSLHFARFGLYIGLIEVPMEIIVGKPNFLTIGFAGGMAAWLQNIRAPFIATFLGSGGFIGGISLYMNRGSD
uniref:Uncharacterized protein n=1 Tax=Strombidium rassoulzadegani TaxID=1082188 RepID=A0A7S3CM59_9SPIT|mmetsp:Transcript_16850/g.28561  ORF Transcript_16850/g.28561 Transcript_16850/m.28561 type:complete len:134 (+) Transcript_16850:185-586(+)